MKLDGHRKSQRGSYMKERTRITTKPQMQLVRPKKTGILTDLEKEKKRKMMRVEGQKKNGKEKKRKERNGLER